MKRQSSQNLRTLSVWAEPRRLMAALAILVMIAATGLGAWSQVRAQSGENTRYAAIVVDAGTGEVLFARHADSRRYPASITKVMTLYLAFEALERGQVSVDDILTVSPLAASQPPSKLGLAAGQTIRLDDAMRATAVRSANDMAVVIAEHIGGSQARFAAMATLKAQELGMTQTRYVNPNGLPDSRQLTSARDLAILARAAMRDYPQYYAYFGQHDWAYEGRGYRNTNGLLHSGNGYDGIKTGFTNASGYNLAASAVRDGRRLIAIVLGGRSSATRNAHVAELMDTGFEVERRRAAGERIQVAQAFFEARGFGIGGPDTGAPVAYASLNGAPTADDEEGQGSNGIAYASLPAAAVPAPTTVAATPPAGYTRATPLPAPVERAAAPPSRPANLTASLNSGVASSSTLNRNAATTTSRPPEPATTRPTAERWSVQVGAFRDETVATEWLTEVNRRFRSQFSNAERNIASAAGWHRSRFTGMTEAAARAACEALDARRVTCMVVRPGG
ncbi:serine hydrolase [Brevundimonas aurifodinae]|uniref:Serine hydrolase n=2 Tax=Brevundimonas TaxID=41275 RepID=A0ABV1NNL1_9CAUL|nr:MAG: serine hydrolase [Brevundimonas subvibrioides]